MNEIRQLTSRNLKIFLRDKTAVFFSLLAMIIVVVLMLVFLGDMNSRSIAQLLDKLGAGTAEQNKKNSELLLLWWTIAGVISVNTVTITLASITTMINDKSQHRLDSFYTAPVSRIKVALGYLISAWIASMIICVMTLVIAETYVIFQGGEMLTAAAHLKALGLIALNSFTYASLMYMLALLVKGEAAWSSLGTIVGTVVGFLGAIYIPMSGLPQGVQSFLKFLPVLHGTSMFRKIICCDSVNTAFKGISAEIVAEFKEDMGITVTIGDKICSGYFQLAFLVVCGIIFLTVSSILMKRRNLSDR